MGIANEIWKVEGIKRGWVWAIGVIKSELEGIGWRNFDFV